MNFIVDDIKSHLESYPESRLIVTGLDRSGKSTFINKNFPEYKVYKSLGVEWYDTSGLYGYFKVFDRFPSIETYVYLTEYDKYKDELLKLCEESLRKFKNSIFVFFLWPRFRNMRTDYLELSAGDKHYSQRYCEVADMIREKIEDSLIIKIEPNLITRIE